MTLIPAGDTLEHTRDHTVDTVPLCHFLCAHVGGSERALEDIHVGVRVCSCFCFYTSSRLSFISCFALAFLDQLSGSPPITAGHKQQV